MQQVRREWEFGDILRAVQRYQTLLEACALPRDEDELFLGDWVVLVMRVYGGHVCKVTESFLHA